jgi:uncharacterized phage-associated protein
MSQVELNQHSVFDIADWFLSKEPTTHRRLQKLVYYAQGWGLALLRRPLAVDENGESISFEAWSRGPMNRDLHRKYHSYLWELLPQTEDNSARFAENELELLENVYQTYIAISAAELEAMTMAEDPWRLARRRTSVQEHQISRITLKPSEIATYFLSEYKGEDYEPQD